MRPIYFIREANAIADVGLINDQYQIFRINVPRKYRGKGFGSRLLKQIIKDADSQGVRLMVGIVASDGLNYDQLEAWYKRHGFEQEEENIYVRPPLDL